MGIENLAGVWPNVAINPATGKTYETEHEQDTREKLNEELETYGKVPDQDERKKQQPMESGDTREQLEADLMELTRAWHDYDGNYMSIYSSVAYAQVKELLERQEAITEYELNSERVALIEEINRLRKVCRTQADSFAAIENENCALRSKLNRIRELAERLQDA